jgi:hypothetical protein
MRAAWGIFNFLERTGANLRLRGMNLSGTGPLSGKPIDYSIF